MQKNEPTKTLIAIPDGYKYVEVLSVGKIIAKPIKDIPNGATYKMTIVDEFVKESNHAE